MTDSKNENLLSEELLTLLKRMESKDNSAFSNDNGSWKAYRIAEQLNDPDLIPLLIQFIENESGNEDLKKVSFIVLRYVYKNSETSIDEDKFVSLLALFQRKEGLLVEALRTIRESEQLTSEDLVLKIISLVDDDRQMVRNWAIRSLQSFKLNTELIESALLEVIKNYYDQYDLKYACETLENVGTKDVVPRLKKVLLMDEYCKDDVILFVRNAIEAISLK